MFYLRLISNFLILFNFGILQEIAPNEETQKLFNVS